MIPPHQGVGYERPILRPPAAPPLSDPWCDACLADACAFPALITAWRAAFRAPALWFGFVQIAGYAYSHPYGPGLPETDHSHAAGDLRQAQLAALQLPHVGMTTAVDTGDWSNVRAANHRVLSAQPRLPI